MPEDKTEKRANAGMKLAFRVFINVGVVLFLHHYFDTFFVLEGGYQAIAIVALTFTVLNMIVIPILNVLSLPIKLIAWLVAFILVNAAAVYITIWFITAIAIPGVSLAIEGSFIGWILVSAVLGAGNWLVRAIVK